MSLDRVLRALMDLGLCEVDAQIYVFLALNGSYKAKELTKQMNQNKRQVYRSLKNLKENCVVVSSLDVPAVFSAVSFEKVLDTLSIKKQAQAQALEKVKEELLRSWKKMVEQNSESIECELVKDEDYKEIDC